MGIAAAPFPAPGQQWLGFCFPLRGALHFVLKGHPGGENMLFGVTLEYERSVVSSWTN